MAEPASDPAPEAPAPASTGELEVDAEIIDNDSAYGDEVASYTTSVTSSVFHYPEQHGRRYHAFREGRYLLPNDEQESDRLDLYHEMMRNIMSGKLFLAPLDEKTLRRAMDIGTGTGIWSIDFADQFPDAQVTGSDLSPIQPTSIPANLKFVVDDIEDEWGYEQDPFDFIHARYLAVSMRNYKKVIQQAYNCTKPGGWVEFQDWDSMVKSTDGTLKGTTLEQYYIEILGLFDKVGYVSTPGPHMEGWFQDAGFVNITVKKYVIPVGTWPKDKHYKRIGAFNRAQIAQGLEAAGLAVACGMGGWSKEEVAVMCAKVRKDMDNPRVHALFDFYVVYGQKPEATTTTAPTDP